MSSDNVLDLPLELIHMIATKLDSIGLTSAIVVFSDFKNTMIYELLGKDLKHLHRKNYHVLELALQYINDTQMYDLYKKRLSKLKKEYFIEKYTLDQMMTKILDGDTNKELFEKIIRDQLSGIDNIRDSCKLCLSHGIIDYTFHNLNGTVGEWATSGDDIPSACSQCGEKYCTGHLNRCKECKYYICGDCKLVQKPRFDIIQDYKRVVDGDIEEKFCTSCYCFTNIIKTMDATDYDFYDYPFKEFLDNKIMEYECALKDDEI